MISVVLIAFVVYFTIKMIKRDVDDFSHIKEIQKKIHKYSGVNPYYYEQYLANFNLAKHTIKDVNQSKVFFHQAIQYLEELSLFGVAGDLDIHDEMTYLIQELGYNFEKMLLNSAINSGVRFIPVYLNEKITA
jgi:hypothetical protein